MNLSSRKSLHCSSMPHTERVDKSSVYLSSSTVFCGRKANELRNRSLLRRRVGRRHIEATRVKEI